MRLTTRIMMLAALTLIAPLVVPETAGAFATICTECILPPSQVDTLRNNVVYMGKAIEASNPLKPHTVRVVILKKNKVVGDCSGTILFNDMVTTSAHCLIKGDSVRVEFPKENGALNITTAAFKTHPSFKKIGDDGDIGLIKIGDGNLPEGFASATLDLSTPNRNANYVYAGAGLNRDPKKDDPTGETGGLGVNRYGTTEMKKMDKGIEYIVTQTSDGTATCAGDSGGGLFRSSNNQVLLSGVLAGDSIAGDGCVYNPNAKAYYTSVVKYQYWMEDTAEELRKKKTPIIVASNQKGQI